MEKITNDRVKFSKDSYATATEKRYIKEGLALGATEWTSPRKRFVVHSFDGYNMEIRVFETASNSRDEKYENWSRVILTIKPSATNLSGCSEDLVIESEAEVESVLTDEQLSDELTEDVNVLLTSTESVDSGMTKQELNNAKNKVITELKNKGFLFDSDRYYDLGLLSGVLELADETPKDYLLTRGVKMRPEIPTEKTDNTPSINPINNDALVVELAETLCRVQEQSIGKLTGFSEGLEYVKRYQIVHKPTGVVIIKMGINEDFTELSQVKAVLDNTKAELDKLGFLNYDYIPLVIPTEQFNKIVEVFKEEKRKLTSPIRDEESVEDIYAKYFTS